MFCRILMDNLECQPPCFLLRISSCGKTAPPAKDKHTRYFRLSLSLPSCLLSNIPESVRFIFQAWKQKHQIPPSLVIQVACNKKTTFFGQPFQLDSFFCFGILGSGLKTTFAKTYSHRVNRQNSRMQTETGSADKIKQLYYAQK